MQKSWLGRVVGVVIAIGATLGFKFWDKSQASDEAKTELVRLCGTDTECVGSVNTHFESCFDASYSMGGRRQSGSLNVQTLATCINGHAGRELFVAN